MYDLERIAIITEDTKMYLTKLKKINIKSIKDLEDDLNFYAVSMLMFSAINRAIDLGDEIIKSKKLGYPVEVKEIFILLSENKIISKELELKLKNLVLARNKLAHRYGSVKTRDVFELIKEMKYLEQFIEEILKEIKKG